MIEKSLSEMLDACRPDGRGLQEPELTVLADAVQQDATLQATLLRSQELDVAIGVAIRTPTLPPGLCERLLAALDSQSGATDESSDVADESSVELTTVMPRKPLSKPHRRRLLIGGAATALAVAISLWALVALWPVSQTQDLSSESAVAVAADVWNEKLEQSNQWEPAAAAPWQSFPLPAGLRTGVGRWCWVTPQRIACYDLTTHGAQVRLFVLLEPASVPATRTPPAGYPSPLGWHVGAWTSQPVVYVLAVQSQQPTSIDVYRELRIQMQRSTDTLARQRLAKKYREV